MSDHKRDSNRVGLVIEIKISHENKMICILKSRNISDKGVFLDFDDEPLKLPIGAHVILEVCAQLDNEPPPPVHAEIVRITDEGMGLQFIL